MHSYGSLGVPQTARSHNQCIDRSIQIHMRCENPYTYITITSRLRLVNLFVEVSLVCVVPRTLFQKISRIINSILDLSNYGKRNKSKTFMDQSLRSTYSNLHFSVDPCRLFFLQAVNIQRWNTIHAPHCTTLYIFAVWFPLFLGQYSIT